MNSMLRLALVVVLGLTMAAAATADEETAATPRFVDVRPIAPEAGHDASKMEAVKSYGSALDLTRGGDTGGYDATDKMDAITSPRGGSSQRAGDDAFRQHVWMGP